MTCFSLNPRKMRLTLFLVDIPQKPSDKPEQNPTDKPDTKPEQKPTDKPVQKPTEKPRKNNGTNTGTSTHVGFFATTALASATAVLGLFGYKRRNKKK